MAFPKRTDPFPCSDLMWSLVQHLQLHSPGTDVGATREGMLWPRRGCCRPWRDAVDHKGMLQLMKGCCLLLAASCHGYKVKCFWWTKETMNSGRPASLQPALGTTVMPCVERTKVGEAPTPWKATAHARALSFAVRCKFKKEKIINSKLTSSFSHSSHTLLSLSSLIKKGKKVMLAGGAHSVFLTANTRFCATNRGKQPVCHETAKCLLLPYAGCPKLVLLIFSDTYARLSCFVGVFFLVLVFLKYCILEYFEYSEKCSRELEYYKKFLHLEE